MRAAWGKAVALGDDFPTSEWPALAVLLWACWRGSINKFTSRPPPNRGATRWGKAASNGLPVPPSSVFVLATVESQVPFTAN